MWRVGPYDEAMRVFSQAFAGGLFGKIAGALFLAMWIVIGFGPDVWAEYLATGYLRNTDSHLGSAISDMAKYSAWGRWYAAQVLANSGQP
jgi:hypothetical protein